MAEKKITLDAVKINSTAGIKSNSKKLAENRKFQEDSRNDAAVEAKKARIKEIKAELKELEAKWWESRMFRQLKKLGVLNGDY